MTYSHEGPAVRPQTSAVRLDMSMEEFEEFLLLLGYAASAAIGKHDMPGFWRWIKFANKVNATNPNFTPYEIPEEYRT